MSHYQLFLLGLLISAKMVSQVAYKYTVVVVNSQYQC